MPFSMSTVFSVRLPSSSTLSEPRRPGMVPLSDLNAHQARRQLVREIALEDAVLDEHRILGPVAFVVHVERASAAGHGSVVRSECPSGATTTCQRDSP